MTLYRLLMVLSALMLGCPEGVKPADVQVDVFDVEIEVEEIEGEELIVPEDADIDIDDLVEVEDIEDAVEAPGVKFDRAMFSGGFAGMKNSKYSLRLGMVNHPIGKEVEVKNSKYKLKAGFLSFVNK